jgi:hypothetical protein
MDTAIEKLSGMNLTFQDTTDKQYQKLQSFRNVTSYSMLSELHSCPRKFQLIKSRAASGGSQSNNVDFAYGHAVGSGAQAWLSSGGDMNAAIFNTMMAWRMPYEACIETKRKSIWNAVLAVQKYAEFHREYLDDWQVWTLPNGKPAIELSVSIDFENGYKHYIHIDVILEHKVTGKLAVQENKTSGFKSVEEAIYANSSQALSYAVVVDMLREHTSYEVFYCVYSSTDREWSLLPFTKHTSLKAEWINDVKLDHATLSTYKAISFYPKRGESCYNFMRRCEFFGVCNLTSTLVEPVELDTLDEAERVDYSFKISDIIARQHSRNEAIPLPAAGFSSIN